MERLDVAGFDGVVAKRLAEPYRPGSREAVVKIKRIQTADCVVIGLRWAENRERIATMLLGLYDDGGELRYVGSTAVAPKRDAEIAALQLLCSRARPSAASASPIDGAAASSKRPPFGPRWSSRCATTSGRACASATARNCCASVPTRMRRSASSSRCDRYRAPAIRPSRASRRVGPPHLRGAEIRTPGHLLPRYRRVALGASLQARKRLPERRHEVTAMTVQLELKAMTELIERKRISRLIAFGSVSFSALIAIIASLLAIAA